MANDLVTPGELEYLPGATFTDEETDAAVAAVRAECLWHIAPERTDDGADTVVLDVDWFQPWLRLPTRKLVSVDEIRDTKTATIIAPATYSVSIASNRVLKLGGFWPEGVGRIEVDITHGYGVVPPDLLSLIAAVATSQRLVGMRSPRMNEPGNQIPEGVGGYAVTDVGRYVVPEVPILSSCVLENYSLRMPGLA